MLAQPDAVPLAKADLVSRLGRRFFRRDPVTLAKALLGQSLVRIVDGHRLVGRIVEVEAYLGIEDRAAHTFGGRRTARNETMWGDGGHLYVYFTYGMHHCANVVAEREGQPTAVLLRALEPIEGQPIMRQNRATRMAADRLRDTDFCSGPAKLCQALAIDRQLDGTDLVTSEALFIERGRAVRPADIVESPRIGIGYAGEWVDRPLRFHIRGHSHVSR